MNHLISVKSLNQKMIMQLILKTIEMKKNTYQYKYNLQDKILVNYFCEPSTRTSCSFQIAMYKLGGNVIHVDEQTSSVKKGESIEDTIKTLSYYGNIIVMRHPLKESILRASKVATVPIINAGNGNGEHPTQALLDIFTIYTELQSRGISLYDPITITFVGDLKNGRTIHSLIYILYHFPSIRFNYLCPSGLEMPEEIYDEIANKKLSQQYISSLEETLEKSDIFYFTRIQKERIDSSTHLSEYDKIQPYSITLKEVSKMKPTAIIMHPLPRLDEIHFEVDCDKRAVYYKQIDNGIYMRMTILHEMLTNTNTNLFH